MALGQRGCQVRQVLPLVGEADARQGAEAGLDQAEVGLDPGPYPPRSEFLDPLQALPRVGEVPAQAQGMGAAARGRLEQ